MQHGSHSILIAALAILIVGCAAETPTQAPGNSDGTAAVMVALATGQESNGFAAMVEDAIAIGMQPDSDAVTIFAANAAVEAPGSSLPRSLQPDDRFVRRMERDNVVSEWRMSYRPLGYGNDSGARAIEVESDGVYRSSKATMRGAAVGMLEVRQKRESEAEIIGSYIYNGSMSIHESDDEAYSAVRIVFTWNRLRLNAGEEGRIGGVVDVSISASGPQGIMSKNGRLAFDGTHRALLTISGREFIIDVRRGLKR
jgi:hypothetical protein